MRLLGLLLLPVFNVAVKFQASPVTRVTRLLEQLKDRVVKQGEDEEKLWEKMQCHCKKTLKDLEGGISQEQSRLPVLQSDLTQMTSQKAQLEAEKEQASVDKSEALAALKGARSLRQKDSKDYVALKAEAEKSIVAVENAMAALEKGLAGSFLQTNDADVLRQMVSSANLRVSDRDALASIFAAQDASATSPSSSMVVGTLQSMRDSMKEDQAAADAHETEAQQSFLGMARAKTAEMATLDTEIEAKTTRIGQISVDMVNTQSSIDDSIKKVKEDSQFLADTKESCAQQEQDWQSRTTARQEELHAIAETQELLGNEEAQGIFEKVMPTKPGLALLQVSSTSASDGTGKALDSLQGSQDSRVALLALALRSGKIDFKKVQAKVSEMVNILRKEQRDEDKKLDWCKAESRSSEDNLRSLKEEAEDLSKIMDEVKTDKVQVEEEILAMTKKIQELDQQVEESKEQRQNENKEYKQAIADSVRACDLLQRAKDRLSRFYTSTAASAKAEVALLAQRRLRLQKIALASRAIEAAGAGLRVASEKADVWPPALNGDDLQLTEVAASPKASLKSFSGYEKQESGSTVTAMLDTIVEDLGKERKAMDKQEADAQVAYEKLAEDAQRSREEATRSLAEKSGVNAGLERRMLSLDQKTSTNVEGQQSANKYLAALREDCGNFVKTYQERKQARAGEVDRLESAGALLGESR